MAVRSTATFLQAGSHPAEDVRRMIFSLIGQRGGIVNSGDFAVTANGTPNMSVNVATGDGFVPGSEATYQGAYHCENRGSLNVPIAASDPTNARIDLIVMRVKDEAYSGATSAFSIEVKQGTAAASPAVPTPDANCWVLAQIAVGAGVTTIVTGNITDKRTSWTGQHRATALGGTIVCTSTTRPTVNLSAGLIIFETDTKTTYAYSGSAWERLSAVATAWTAPTLLNGWVNYGSGNVDAAYRKIGDIVYLRGQVKNGTTTSGTSIYTLPSGFRPLAQVVVPTIDGNNALGRFDITTAGAVIIQVGANNAFGVNASFSTI